MTAERYELRADHTDWLDVRDPQGYRNTINQPGAVALIRQQARDLDQLRTDLAAAVAENAALLAANRDCILHFDAIKADYDAMKLRAEQAEARLAAIDGAPTVADVIAGLDGGKCVQELAFGLFVPDIGTELIARPAKD